MGFKLKDLVFNVEKTLEGDILVVEPPKVYEGYREGIKIGPEGLSYTCLSVGLNYEKVIIKVAGSTQPPFNYNDTPVRVEFEGLEGKVWQDFNNKGEIKLSVTAKSIRPFTEKRIKMNMEDKA